MSQVSVFSKTSVTDFFGQPATPANPPANQARMFYRSDNDTFHVIDSAGVDLLGGGAPAFGAITSGTNTSALTIGTGGVLSATGTGVITATSLKLAPIVLLSGGADAIPAHTPGTYMVTTAGVDAMTIAAPTVTTDDGIVIKVTTNTNAAHTITFTGGTLRPGTAAVTTVNFASFRGSSIELMAWQGAWYVMAQNNIASYA
jgi:hypothetical protein